MDDFISKVKQGAQKVCNEAEKFTNVAVTKTKEVYDRTKAHYTISGLENKIDAILIELGKKLYDEYKNGAEFGEDLAEKFAEIDGYNKEITEIRLKIAEADNSKICTECNELNKDNALFCSKCGNKF